MPLFPFAGATARGRRRARPDPNQAAIVLALRQAGASVEILADVGRGVPDLLVGVCRAGGCPDGAVRRADLPPALTPFGGVLDERWNFLLEVKSPRRGRGKRGVGAGRNARQVELNETEARWHKNWRGQVAVVATVAEALAACFLDVRSARDGVPRVEERLAGFHRHTDEDEARAAAELARGDAAKARAAKRLDSAASAR